jgi:hypothetical protein
MFGRIILLSIFAVFGCKHKGVSKVSGDGGSNNSGPKVAFYNNYDPTALKTFVPLHSLPNFTLATDKSHPDAKARDRKNGDTYAKIIAVVREHEQQLVRDYRVDSRRDQANARSPKSVLYFFPLIEDASISPAGKIIFGEIGSSVRLNQTYFFRNGAGGNTYIPIEGGSILVHLTPDGAIAGFDSFLVPPPIAISSVKDTKFPEQFTRYQEIAGLNLSYQSMRPTRAQVDELRARFLSAVPPKGSQTPGAESIPEEAQKALTEIKFPQIDEQTPEAIGKDLKNYSEISSAQANAVAGFLERVAQSPHKLVFAKASQDSEEYRLAWKVEGPLDIPVVVYLLAEPKADDQVVLKMFPLHETLQATGVLSIYNGTKAKPRGDGYPALSNVSSPFKNVSEMQQVFETLVASWKQDPTFFPDPKNLLMANLYGAYAMGKLLDFYGREFNWDSFDGRGNELEIAVSLSDLKHNAMFSPASKMLIFGSESPGENSFIYDIAVGGHELTHSIIGQTAGLAYNGESGALNEHIADMVGVHFKNATLGLRNNFEIGEIVTATEKGKQNYPYRDFLNFKRSPWAAAYPPRYDAPEANVYRVRCFPSALNDHCGVHFMSLLPNKVGALTVRAYQEAYEATLPDADKVDPAKGQFGWKKYSRLLWDTLTRRLGRDSTFIEYRNAIVDVCSTFVKNADPMFVQNDCDILAKNFDEVGIPVKDPFNDIVPGEVACQVHSADSTANVRKEPSSKGELVAVLNEGDKFRQLGTSGKWLQVRFTSGGLEYGGPGEKLYLSSTLAKCDSPNASGGSSDDLYKLIRPSGQFAPGEQLCVVTSSTLNARTIPDTKTSQILNVLPNGTPFIATLAKDKWKRSEYILNGNLFGVIAQGGQGQAHWLSGDFASCRNP